MGKTLLKVAVGYVLAMGLTIALYYPYHTDQIAAPQARKEARSFYTDIYSAPVSSESMDVAEEENSAYVQMAKKAIKRDRIVERVTDFARSHDLLHGKRVLDVGAGSGYLQDVVENYVGLDISPSARRYFHKPFVEASATDMPFADGEFDALWSIWVLEHVPKPEMALQEIRRVTKDGGLLFLLPAWGCNPWAAEGYPVRPYSDFDWKGKAIKATMPIVFSPWYRIVTLLPVRWARIQQARLSGGPTRLHYNQLEPNYKDYWMPDSDAINDIDFLDAKLWFTSRGDECLSCSENELLQMGELVIRVHKQPSTLSASGRK
jgi:SAM-dependent methyltransferase